MFVMRSSIHHQLLDHLARTKGRWSEVASGSGVSKRTLEKIARQETADPRISIVQKLLDFFEGANTHHKSWVEHKHSSVKVKL